MTVPSRSLVRAGERNLPRTVLVAVAFAVVVLVLVVILPRDLTTYDYQGLSFAHPTSWIATRVQGTSPYRESAFLYLSNRTIPAYACGPGTDPALPPGSSTVVVCSLTPVASLAPSDVIVVFSSGARMGQPTAPARGEAIAVDGQSVILQTDRPGLMGAQESLWTVLVWNPGSATRITASFGGSDLAANESSFRSLLASLKG